MSEYDTAPGRPDFEREPAVETWRETIHTRWWCSYCPTSYGSEQELWAHFVQAHPATQLSTGAQLRRALEANQELARQLQVIERRFDETRAASEKVVERLGLARAENADLRQDLHEAREALDAALRDWSRSDADCRQLAAENARLTALLDRMPGYHLTDKGLAATAVVHLATTDRTDCCGRRLVDLPSGDRTTLNPHAATCRLKEQP